MAVYVPIGQAGIASDMVVDMCESHHDHFFMAEKFPYHIIPQGEENYEQRRSFVLGLNIIMNAVMRVIRAGGHPDVPGVIYELQEMDSVNAKFMNGEATIKNYDFYVECGGNLDYALEALVDKTEGDWENGCLRGIVEDDEVYQKLPKCEKHDLNWETAKDVMLG